MTDLYDGLPQFLSVARLSSFRGAALELGLTPGAVSQSIKALEMRLGVLLFVRTTRKVALTEAGRQFAERLAGVHEAVEEAVREIGLFQTRPSGTLRLCIRRMAIPQIIEKALPLFRRAYPEVSVEIDVRDGPIDLIGEGFDAAVRIGEYLEPDMIAVPIGKHFRWVVVGAPSYLAEWGIPNTPIDVMQHECIRFRLRGDSNVYRWEFRDHEKEILVDPPGNMVVSDSAVLCKLAEQGLGLAYTSDTAIGDAIRDGRLSIVLKDYMPFSDRLFLYFAARSHTQPKLRAFIDVLNGDVTSGVPPLFPRNKNI